MSYFRSFKLNDYERYIGSEAIDRIYEKAELVDGKRIVHINSTFYGGGVAELLSSLTFLMNHVGIKCGWRVLQGAPDFFGITKKIHNALQGEEIRLSQLKKEIYDDVIYENAIRNHLDNHDIVVVHDPQPLGMIQHYQKKGPWIWRCHIDLSNVNKKIWRYLEPFVEQYDATIFSLEDYRKKIKTPQVFMMPAIDPFSIKNKELSETEIEERLDYYNIPTDLPLVVQISRFDYWKDPEGVIRAFKLALKEVDARLVLLGNFATDDPEGEKIYHAILSEKDERIMILSRDDTALVNALQRRAAVVLQKSIREGFGLTVTEAMWKGAAVVGSNVGGIRHQIKQGVNGFLVNSVEETAEVIVKLIRDPSLRKQIGQNARESVRERFLMPRLLEQYLDLFNSFETIYRLRR